MNASVLENPVLDKFTAIDFLVNGSGKRILCNDISWDEYELFLHDFEEKAGWRLTYDRGKLEIMPTTFERETFGISFRDFILAYCEHFDLVMEGGGSTTFRRKPLEKGVEPDECFYLQSAAKVIGKKFPKRDYPIPDIAVEIDVTTDSIDKFLIHAALEVPEVWIYDGENVCFYELIGENYHQITNSRALPLLSAKKLTGFLELSQTKGQTFALKSFREWLNVEKLNSE